MKKKFINDYEIVTNEKNNKKQLIYRGTMYQLDLPPQKIWQHKIQMLMNALFMVALFIAMGFAGNDATRTLSVGLPYALLIIPILYACFDAVYFLVRTKPMERAHFEGSFLHMLSWSVIIMLLSAAVLIGDIVYVIKMSEIIAGEYVFIPLAALLFLSAYFLFRQTRRIKKNITETKEPRSDES